MITISTFGKKTAILLDGRGESVLSLSRVGFVAHLAQAGTILLRNFQVDSQLFGELVNKHSSHVCERRKKARKPLTVTESESGKSCCRKLATSSPSTNSNTLARFQKSAGRRL